MELIRNETTGRLIVLLNGISYFDCRDDLDCPGLAFCRSQEKFHWIDGPNSSSTQCICPWFLATQGALCDEQTSFTWGLFAIIVIYGLFSLAALSITLWVIWIAGRQRWKNRRNGSQTIGQSTASSRKQGTSNQMGFTFTLVPLFIANFFMVMYSVQWLIRLIQVWGSEVYEEDGLIWKRTTLWVVERAAFILSFVAFAMAMNNFSLLWIEVLNSATRVVRSRVSIRNYKRFLAVLYLATFIGIVVFLVNGLFENIALVCTPANIVVCVFGGVAFYKVRKVEKVMLRKQQTSADSDHHPRTSVLNLLGQVRSVAGSVFLFTFCLLVCSLVFAVAENRPDQYLQQFFGMFIFFFAGLDLLVVSWFMLRTMRRSPLSSANDGSLSSKPNQHPARQDQQQLQHMAIVAPMVAVCEDVPGSIAMTSLPPHPSTGLDEEGQTVQQDEPVTEVATEEADELDRSSTAAVLSADAVVGSKAAPEAEVRVSTTDKDLMSDEPTSYNRESGTVKARSSSSGNGR